MRATSAARFAFVAELVSFWVLALTLSWLGEEGISIAKDSIQPQVPLRLPCYDFTPVEDPTVVCANKTTKSLCGTSGTQKSWVIIGPMLRAKPIPRV
jgi:hypothetical protein